MITLTTGIKNVRIPTVETKNLGDQRVGTYALLSCRPTGTRTIKDFEADKSSFAKVVILQHNYEGKTVRALKFNNTLEDDLVIDFPANTPCYPLKCVKLELEANFDY